MGWEFRRVEVEQVAAEDCKQAFEVMSDGPSHFHCCIGSPCRFVHFELGSGGRQLKELDILRSNSFVARYHNL